MDNRLGEQSNSPTFENQDDFSQMGIVVKPLNDNESTNYQLPHLLTPPETSRHVRQNQSQISKHESYQNNKSTDNDDRQSKLIIDETIKDEGALLISKGTTSFLNHKQGPSLLNKQNGLQITKSKHLISSIHMSNINKQQMILMDQNSSLYQSVNSHPFAMSGEKKKQTEEEDEKCLDSQVSSLPNEVSSVKGAPKRRGKGQRGGRGELHDGHKDQRIVNIDKQNVVQFEDQADKSSQSETKVISDQMNQFNENQDQIGQESPRINIVQGASLDFTILKNSDFGIDFEKNSKNQNNNLCQEAVGDQEKQFEDVQIKKTINIFPDQSRDIQNDQASPNCSNDLEVLDKVANSPNILIPLKSIPDVNQKLQIKDQSKIKTQDIQPILMPHPWQIRQSFKRKPRHRMSVSMANVNFGAIGSRMGSFSQNLMHQLYFDRSSGLGATGIGSGTVSARKQQSQTKRMSQNGYGMIVNQQFKGKEINRDIFFDNTGMGNISSSKSKLNSQKSKMASPDSKSQIKFKNDQKLDFSIQAQKATNVSVLSSQKQYNQIKDASGSKSNSKRKTSTTNIQLNKQNVSDSTQNVILNKNTLVFDQNQIKNSQIQSNQISIENQVLSRDIQAHQEHKNNFENQEIYQKKQYELHLPNKTHQKRYNDSLIRGTQSDDNKRANRMVNLSNIPNQINLAVINPIDQEQSEENGADASCIDIKHQSILINQQSQNQNIITKTSSAHLPKKNSSKPSQDKINSTNANKIIVGTALIESTQEAERPFNQEKTLTKKEITSSTDTNPPIIEAREHFVRINLLKRKRDELIQQINEERVQQIDNKLTNEVRKNDHKSGYNGLKNRLISPIKTHFSQNHKNYHEIRAKKLNQLIHLQRLLNAEEKAMQMRQYFSGQSQESKAQVAQINDSGQFLENQSMEMDRLKDKPVISLNVSDISQPKFTAASGINQQIPHGYPGSPGSLLVKEKEFGCEITGQNRSAMARLSKSSENSLFTTQYQQNLSSNEVEHADYLRHVAQIRDSSFIIKKSGQIISFDQQNLNDGQYLFMFGGDNMNKQGYYKYDKGRKLNILNYSQFAGSSLANYKNIQRKQMEQMGFSKKPSATNQRYLNLTKNYYKEAKKAFKKLDEQDDKVSPRLNKSLGPQPSLSPSNEQILIKSSSKQLSPISDNYPSNFLSQEVSSNSIAYSGHLSPSGHDTQNPFTVSLKRQDLIESMCSFLERERNVQRMEGQQRGRGIRAIEQREYIGAAQESLIRKRNWVNQIVGTNIIKPQLYQNNLRI